MKYVFLLIILYQAINRLAGFQNTYVSKDPVTRPDHSRPAVIRG
jgi:hypothetical protein